MLERLLSNHIVHYLESNNILSSKQFGFRAGHSTEDQLLLTYADVVKYLDCGKSVDMVFLDYSKAFDVVNHTVLLGKLSDLGFSDQIVWWIGLFSL